MSPSPPFGRGTQIESNWSGRPSTTTGTLITASATPHTLSGTPQTIFAATSFDTFWVTVLVYASAIAVTDTSQLMNIYTGAASSEVVLIPNLLTGWAAAGNAAFPYRIYEFPLFIPQGTRISADLQALIGSDNVRVIMNLYGGGFITGGWAGQGIECLGADTANSRGTLITPGSTSEGSWTSIGTSAYEYRYVLPMVARNSDTAAATRLLAVDIGTGSAVIDGQTDYLFQGNTSEVMSQQGSALGRFARIPASTALQARAQSSSSGVDGTDVCIYGVYG